MTHADQTVPDWVIGCMERKYIVLEGVRDPSPAIWVQTGSQYIDIRIPHDRPQFRGKRSLNDLGIEELFELARQSADTGVCRIENRLATWNSWADRFGFWCDEADIFPDDGCLEPRRGTIFETETENSGVKYEEAWVLQPYDQGIVAHLTLRPLADPAAVLGVLLVTGRYAGYVERSTSANQASLQAQLGAANGDLARMRQILDCEASYAVRERVGAPFVIRHSCLPFREGRELDVPVMSRPILERETSLRARRDDAAWRVESWLIKR